MEGGSGWRTSGLEPVAGWDVGQMVLRQDLQCLFPSNLDLAVRVLTVKAPFIRQWFCLIFKDPDLRPRLRRRKGKKQRRGDGGLVRGI